MRTSMENVFVQLQQDVSALGKAIQPSIDAHETPAKRELAQKRLNYLLRTADNLPRLFKLFAESNERSLVFREPTR